MERLLPQACLPSDRGVGGETGDLLDLRLREGQVHTADGGLEFVLEVLERAERHLCERAAVRFDAGYPGEELIAAYARDPSDPAFR